MALAVSEVPGNNDVKTRASNVLARGPGGNMESKELFETIYRNCIKREGAPELFAWLEKSDFFKAPASTRFHLACEGGLCQHSLNVYNRLVTLLKDDGLKARCFPNCQNEGEVSESIAIVALLHDICKANFYSVEMRNRKDEHGEWHEVPFYTVKDKLPYGHGEKSVYIINGFLRLKRPEAMAIRWHMGAFADQEKMNILGQAYDEYPIAMLLHMADMLASHIDEVGL